MRAVEPLDLATRGHELICQHTNELDSAGPTRMLGRVREDQRDQLGRLDRIVDVDLVVAPVRARPRIAVPDALLQRYDSGHPVTSPAAQPMPQSDPAQGDAIPHVPPQRTSSGTSALLTYASNCP